MTEAKTIIIPSKEQFIGGILKALRERQDGNSDNLLITRKAYGIYFDGKTQDEIVHVSRIIDPYSIDLLQWLSEQPAEEMIFNMETVVLFPDGQFEPHIRTFISWLINFNFSSFEHFKDVMKILTRIIEKIINCNSISERREIQIIYSILCEFFINHGFDHDDEIEFNFDRLGNFMAIFNKMFMKCPMIVNEPAKNSNIVFAIWFYDYLSKQQSYEPKLMENNQVLLNVHLMILNSFCELLDEFYTTKPSWNRFETNAEILKNMILDDRPLFPWILEYLIALLKKSTKQQSIRFIKFVEFRNVNFSAKLYRQKDGPRLLKEFIDLVNSFQVGGIHLEFKIPPKFSEMKTKHIDSIKELLDNPIMKYFENAIQKGLDGIVNDEEFGRQINHGHIYNFNETLEYFVDDEEGVNRGFLKWFIGNYIVPFLKGNYFKIELLGVKICGDGHIEY